MATFTLNIPAKIVLFGEYFVLKGGHAIASTLQDTHQVQLTTRSEPGVIVSHHHPYNVQKTETYLTRVWEVACQLQSIEPMGCVLHYEASFPHHYGWGASSALVLSLLAFSSVLGTGKLNNSQLWTFYESLKHKLGWVGSGLDSYSQLHGGAWIPYRRGQGLSEKQESVFESAFLQFVDRHPLYFIPTGKKVSSQLAVEKAEENKALEASLPQYKALKDTFCQAIQADDWDGFVRNLNHYVGDLFEIIQPDESYLTRYKTLQSMLKKSAVVKPCGALGGDGFLLWLQSKQNSSLQLLQQAKVSIQPLSLGGRALWIRESKSQSKPLQI